MFGDNILQFYLKKHDFAITSADISGTAGVQNYPVSRVVY
jgi:hypothetical protein